MRRPATEPEPLPPQASAPARVPAWLAAVLLMVVTVLAYQPVWHAGFIWDDDAMLTANPLVQAGGQGLLDIWGSTKFHDCVPLTLTTFWLEWRVWADNPLGYHLVNVLLHALSAVLLWRVLKRLRIPGAWLAAALFAVHPVNVESVAWIAERKNTLAMFFYLLSFLLYLHSDDTRKLRIEDGGWKIAPFPSILHPPSSLRCANPHAPSSLLPYWLSLLAFALALLSKTAVAPFPLVLLGLAWWRRGRVRLKDLWRAVPFFALSAAAALVALWFQYSRAIGASLLDVRSGSLWSRLAGAGWAFWFYLYKAVLPLALSFVYPRWQIDPARLLSCVPSLLMVLAFAVCWRFRHRWGNAALCALGYFLIMLLPVLGFVNIYFMRFSLVSDHWQYFSIIGPIALIAAVLAGARSAGSQTCCIADFQSASAKAPDQAADWKPATQKVGNLRYLRFTLGSALILALGVLTWKQSHIYADQETLWQDTLAKNPACWMAHINLANVLNEKGQVDEAIRQYQEALRLQPNNADAHYNIGTGLLSKGRTDEAITQFKEALRVQPDHVNAHINLGFALLRKGQVTEAISLFREALRLKSNDPLAHYNLGIALERNGQMDEAISQYQEALSLKPDYPDAKDRLTRLLELKRRLTPRTPKPANP